MIILDTDHLTVLIEQAGARCDRLAERMADAETALSERFFATIVSVEEQLRVWLSYIDRFKQVHQQLSAYARLQETVDFSGDLDVLPFKSAAADRFARLRRAGLRIGTMDLKISSIALAHEVSSSPPTLQTSARFPDCEWRTGLRSWDSPIVL